MYSSINYIRFGRSKIECGTTWNRGVHCFINRFHVPLSGSAKLLVDDREYPLEVGFAYILPMNPNMIFLTGEDETYDHLFVDFNVSPNLKDQEPIVIDVNSNKKLLQYIDLLLTFSQDDCREIVSDIKSHVYYLLKSVFLYVFEEYAIEQYDNDQLSSAIEYIYKNYSSDIKNDDIAKSIHVHPRHLIRLFEDKIGKTPHQFLVEYRIEVAKSMLEEGRRVSEVCYCCGFNNIKTFGNAFKRVIGCLPSDVYPEGKKQNFK